MSENILPQIELMQAISARLCHDLAGGIGTINNCVELMDNKNNLISSKAQNLIAYESANLVHKIKFFRTAYGNIDNEKEFNLGFFFSQIRDYFSGTNVKFISNYSKGLTLIDSVIAKILMTLAIIVSEKIGVSGSMTLFLHRLDLDGNDLSISLIAKAKKKLNIREGESSIFDNKDTKNINVSNCREYYIKYLCQIIGYNIYVNKIDDHNVKYELNKVT